MEAAESRCVLLTLTHTLADDAGMLFGDRLLTPSEASLGAHWEERPANAGGLGLIPGLGVNLEKERAAHPSIPPWEISWTVEPGGLQSIGSRKNWRRLATE